MIIRIMFRDDAEDEENTPKINSFFKKARVKKEIPRHRFYYEQGLTSRTEI